MCRKSAPLHGSCGMAPAAVAVVIGLDRIAQLVLQHACIKAIANWFIWNRPACQQGRRPCCPTTIDPLSRLSWRRWISKQTDQRCMQMFLCARTWCCKWCQRVVQRIDCSIAGGGTRMYNFYSYCTDARQSENDDSQGRLSSGEIYFSGFVRAQASSVPTQLPK